MSRASGAGVGRCSRPAATYALAARLADRAAALCRAVRAALAAEPENGRLRRLTRALRVSLGHNPTDDEFADMYAQTLACGWLSARFGPHPGAAAESVLRVGSPWFRALLAPFLDPEGQANAANGGPGDFFQLAARALRDALGETDVEDLLRDFGSRHPQEDPLIHFYAIFLQEYDRQTRRSRGVFYTPAPIVSCIVRSVDEILRAEFGLADGLADTSTWAEMARRLPGLSIPEETGPAEPFVQILDPAAGTGNFLAEVIHVVHRTMASKWRAGGRGAAEIAGLWSEYVPRHLLPRLYGFELLMPSYAIAHLKLAMTLAETGYRFPEGVTARLYLTNSLEPARGAPPGGPRLAPDLAREFREARRAKSQLAATVVLGNPPYAAISSNKNPWIDGLLKGQLPGGRRTGSYYEVDGRPLGEKKVWLQDDYVKFIRYGQWRIERSGAGIMGCISNHSFLDHPTFRGMRQCLWTTFPQITLLDLHGNAKNKEVCPDGDADANLFPIEQGVAISLMWRAPGPQVPAVRHGDVWGSRAAKCQMLQARTALSLASARLAPRTPFYLFVPFDETHQAEYEAGWKLTDLMPLNVTGMVTARDHFVVDFERSTLLERIAAFRSRALSDQEIRKRFFAGRTRSRNYPAGDSRGWQLSAARRRVRNDPAWDQRLERCLYRPFDKRWVYYADWMVDWPRVERMRHMRSGENVGLIARRQMAGGEATCFFVADELVCDGVIRSDNKGSESLFPLYLLGVPGTSRGTGRQANLHAGFVRAVGEAARLSWREEGHGDLRSCFGPEDLLHLAYAQFFSPTYRARFAPLLRVDFPRVFVPAGPDLFAALCRLGADLVALHLLRVDYSAASWNRRRSRHGNPLERPAIALQGEGPPEVGRGFPRFQDGKVYISRTRWFPEVTAAVWEFRVGSYRVCEKWLKDRRGRALTEEEIAHYGRVVVAIRETLRLMRQVDEVIAAHGGWPRAFVAQPPPLPPR